MNFRRVIVILGGLLGLLILVLAFNSIFNKDKIRPNLDALINSNQQLVDLSDQAKDQLTNFDLQVAAANLSVVVNSDNSHLSAYYQKRYGKSPPKPMKSADNSLAELEAVANTNNYEAKYTQLAKELKDQNQQLINQLLADGGSDLDNLLKTLNQHLDTLFTNI